MIAKITTRTDFSGIVNYANNVKKKSARIIGNNGVLLIDNSTISDSFQAQLHIPGANGKLHHLSKPVKYVSVAFSHALYYCWQWGEDFIKIEGRKGFVPYTL